MRLLLDEHHDPGVARQLRERGYDVVAVAERDDLRGRPDPEIFDAAIAEGRAVVTEDVRDFSLLVVQAAELDRRHPGVILTMGSRYPRRPGTRVRLAEALAALLEEHPSADALSDVMVWLRSPLTDPTEAQRSGE